MNQMSSSFWTLTKVLSRALSFSKTRHVTGVQSKTPWTQGQGRPDLVRHVGTRFQKWRDSGKGVDISFLFSG